MAQDRLDRGRSSRAITGDSNSQIQQLVEGKGTGTASCASSTGKLLSRITGYSGTRPSTSAWKCHHCTVWFLLLQWEKQHTGWARLPRDVVSCHLRGYLEGMKVWHLEMWFSGGLGSAGLTGGFDHLEGLFQGNQFYYSMFRRGSHFWSCAILQLLIIFFVLHSLD